MQARGGHNPQAVGSTRNYGPGKDSRRKETQRERWDQRTQKPQQAQRPPDQNQRQSDRGWGSVGPADDYAGPSGAPSNGRWQQGGPGSAQGWEQNGSSGRHGQRGQQERRGGGDPWGQPVTSYGRYNPRQNGSRGSPAHNRWDSSNGSSQATPIHRDNRQEGFGQEGYQNSGPAYSPPRPAQERWRGEQTWGGNSASRPLNGASNPSDDDLRGWEAFEGERLSQSGAQDLLSDTGGGWGAAGYTDEGSAAAGRYTEGGSATTKKWSRGDRGAGGVTSEWPGLETPARPSFSRGPDQGWRGVNEREGGFAASTAAADDRGSRGEDQRGRAGSMSSSKPWEAMRGAGGRQDLREMSRREKVQVAVLCNRLFLTALETFTTRLAASQRRAGHQDVLQEFVGELASVMSQNEACLDAVNVSTAMQCLATAAMAVPPMGDNLDSSRRLLARLVELGLQLQGSFKMDTVTMTVSSLAKLLGLGSSSPLPLEGSREATDMQVLMEGLAVRAWQRITQPPDLQPHEMVVLIWAYSRMGIDPLGGKLFSLIQQKCAPLVPRFTSQNISNFLIAAVLLDKPLSPPLLEALARQAVLQMPRASPQGVANLLWAFAKLTDESPLEGDLFRAGVSTALEMVGELNAQNVSNILWAVSSVEHRLTPRALRTFVSAFLNNIGSASFLSVAGTLASYKKIEGSQADDPLIARSIRRADEVLGQANLQALGGVLWTLGSFEAGLPADLLRRLDGPWAEHALAELQREWGREGWGPSLAMILWGYSKLRLDPLQGRLFQDTLARLSGADAQGMQPQNLSNVLLAAATVQRRSFSPDFLNHALAKVVAEGSSQSVCNSLWALTALGLLRGPAMASLLQRLAVTKDEAPLNVAEARQLLMAHNMHQAQNQDAPPLVPQDLLQEAADLVAQSPSNANISEFHCQVSATLEAMKVAHAVEFQSPDGLLSIDLVARCGDGNPLALEVDGEQHFTTLPPYRPLGHTVLRNQLIAANGFRGVGVPFYDWTNLDTVEKRVTYLSARLNKWGIGDAAVE